MPKPQSIESVLYDGKVKVKFFPESHQYWVNGKRPKSVTGIIGIKDKSAALVPWAVGLCGEFLGPYIGQKLTQELLTEALGQHSKRKDQAADTGTKIHAWIEDYIKSELKQGELPEMPTDKAVQVGVGAYLEWESTHKVRYVSSERMVYSKKHDYIGTLDIEAVVNGKLCLIDIKSSNGLYNTVRMQTAAYVKADEEESGREYRGRWAIRLAKEDESEYKARMAKKGKVGTGYAVFEAKFLDDKPTDVVDDFGAFLACKTLVEWDRATDFYYQKQAKV